MWIYKTGKGLDDYIVLLTPKQKIIIEKLERGETHVDVVCQGLPFEIYKLSEKEQIAFLREHPFFLDTRDSK